MGKLTRKLFFRNHYFDHYRTINAHACADKGLQMNKHNAPKPPAGLSKKSAAFFLQFCEDYDGVDDAALSVLEKVCVQMDRAADAAAGIKKNGLLCKDRFGVDRASPLVAVERMATLAIVNGLKSLGAFKNDDKPSRYDGKVF
jgi:phage terminase small subunit